MGFVFKARDPFRDELVAIKVVNQLVISEVKRRRFDDEWRALQRIRHPNVVRIFEVDVDLGQPFIAMQLVPGPDLSLFVHREGALSPAMACRVVDHVASALDVLHADGLIHRDIKPANVLIDLTDRHLPHCYVADFGLTRDVGISRSLSRTGVLYGTVPYASPEQHLGRKDIDHRSDVFSLGCVLYFCLVGAPPFRRATEAQVRDAILASEIPTVTGPRPGLPRAIDGVIQRALAVDRDQRFASAGALAAATRRVLAEPPGRPANAPRPAPVKSRPAVPPSAVRRPPSSPQPGGPQTTAMTHTGGRWRSMQVMLVTASLGALIAVVVGALRVSAGLLLMGVLFAVALMVQGFLRTTASAPVAMSPEATLIQAVATVSAVPGWRTVASDAAVARLESAREIHPFVAVLLLATGLLPGLAYILHQRTPSRLDVRVDPIATGSRLTLTARGAEATHRAADVQRALGIL